MHMVLISWEGWHLFLEGIQEVEAGWECGGLWSWEAEMEKWCAGYLEKKAQVGWVKSHGFEEWIESAGIFYIWLYVAKIQLLLFRGAGDYGPRTIPALTWVHPP